MERYKVVKKVGTGTYGSAYLVCFQSDPSQQFVLKKIKLDDDDAKQRASAEHEVSVLSSLEHPFVLGYIDHFMYKGHLCIITEYCEAGDLYGLLRARKAPLPEAQITEWLVQVVLAIQYVHARNILHRDLKTQNIFLTKDSMVKLGDFGISRPLNGSLDLASTIIGTPYYMSPEVMSNQPYDYKSDMWSLGCCVYEMMSLKHAFDASDMSSLVCKIMRGEHLPIPNQFSPDLRDLTKSLLSRVPAKRPSPDAILKLPWLKEYVSKARDRIAKLESHKTPCRSRRATGSGPSDIPNAAHLERELEDARARLAHIQKQRDAIAVLKGAAAARLAASRSNTGNGAAGGDAAAPPRPPLPPGAAAAAACAAGPGPSAGPHGGTARLSGAGGSDPPGGTRNLSRQPSVDDLDIGGNRPSADPKARREQKRQEEIRQREAELLDARRAYFEQRKQAEAKKWHLIHGETRHTSTGGRRATHSDGVGGGGGGMACSGELQGAHRGTGYGAGEWEDDIPHRVGASHSRNGSDAGAAQDFEAELQLLNQGAPGSWGCYNALSGASVAQGGAKERAAALRDLCHSALGPQLTDMLSAMMRQHTHQQQSQGTDDAYFRQDLLQRIGPHRMQYLQLVDALIYYEDAATNSYS